jgi:hypothetical protein
VYGVIVATYGTWAAAPRTKNTHCGELLSKLIVAWMEEEGGDILYIEWYLTTSIEQLASGGLWRPVNGQRWWEEGRGTPELW